jgi:hypothetical protein
MKIVKLLAVLLLFAAPAFSDQVDVFNFNQNLGDIGKTDLLKNGAVQLLLSGFNLPGVSGDLWEKNLGPTEFGLGLENNVDHEIGISGNDFVQLDMSKVSALLSVESVSIGLNSLQPGENYDIWGSNAAGVLGTLIAANQTDPNFTLPLAPFQFISVTAGNGDVLLDNVDVTVATPEPSSIILLIFGALIMGAYFARKTFRCIS